MGPFGECSPKSLSISPNPFPQKPKKLAMHSMFVTDCPLRFLQQNMQIREHNCHLKHACSQTVNHALKTVTIYAHEVCPRLSCDFCVDIMLTKINVQNPFFVFSYLFFRKSGKIMLTKFSPTEMLMVSMVSPHQFWQLDETFFIFGHL